MYQRQRAPQAPPKHSNHQLPTPGRRPQLEERDPVLRDSSLTFAAVWDPESGALQSFTGDSLGKLSNYVEEPAEKELPRPPVPPKTWSTTLRAAHWQSQFDRTRPLGRPAYTPNNTRESQASLLFSDTDSIATIPSIYSDDAETLYGHWQFARQEPLKDTKSSTTRAKDIYAMTPKSQLTFAALWDPTKGFCTLQGGVLVPVSNTPQRPEHRPSKLLYDADFYPTDWDADSEPTLTNSDFLPTPPNSRHAFSLSSLKAKKLTIGTPASPEVPFDYPTQYAAFCESPKQIESSQLPDHDLEDEGFFDSFGNHSDCEPHLPSRFSTTTFYTSSSRYLNADLTSIATPGANSLTFPSTVALEARAAYYNGKPKSIHTPEEDTTPKPRQTRKISLPAIRTKDSGMPHSGSFKLQAPPLPRFSNVLKASWSLKRRPTQEKEKWVLIDVRPIGK